jgi:hypothetical protein
MSTRATLISMASLTFICLLSHHAAIAQSTLVNVPSSDVVPAKKVYLEFDFISNYAWQREAAFETYLPRAVVGVGRNVEAGVNVSYTHVSGDSQPIEVQPNIKWQFYRNEERGMAAAIGCILYVPVTHRAGTNTLGQCYTVLSKKLNGDYAPRFTGGAYVLLNARGEKSKLGAIAGYQQPLAKRVGFIVDWSSGENRFGFVSPGLYFTTTSNSSLSAGYAIANHGRRNNALFVYYGAQF